MNPISGLNFIGDLHGSSGLCEAARNTLDAVIAAGIPTSHVELSYNDQRDLHVGSRYDHLQKNPVYPVNLVYYNINMFPRLSEPSLAQLTNGKYTGAFWVWELPELPSSLWPQMDRVDEIWTASRYVQETCLSVVDKPVVVVPHPIQLTTPAHVDRAKFNIPDDCYVFLFTFAAPSGFARKNPWGVVDAFAKAFGGFRRGGPLLVIKAHHADTFKEGSKALRKAVERVGGLFIGDTYTRAEMNELLACADVYVSLHRGEGFGLGMAEAMYLGKPVIATHYSGNVDFMNHINSYPVSYYLRPITVEDHRYQPEYASLYKPGLLWAEPNIEQSATYMSYLYEHPEEGQQQGQRAQQYIRLHNSPGAIGNIIRERLQQIDPAQRHAGALEYRRVRRQAPAPTYFFEFDEFVPGCGWHGAEQIGSPPTSFYIQWMADKATTFDVQQIATGQGLKLEFAIEHSIYPGPLPDLKVSANGYELPLTSILDHGTMIYQSIISRPMATERPQMVRLTFEVDHTFCPHELDSRNGDTRTLGVPFRWIRLSALTAAPDMPVPKTELSKLQQNWNKLAEKDALWAILTTPEKKGGKWDLGEFFEKGRHEINYVLDLIAELQFPLRFGRALDFGCGVGRLTQALCHHFKECVGVDIAPAMIEQARAYNQFGSQCRYLLNQSADLKLLQDDFFDFVYTNIVLQHIEPVYTENYIAEFIRVLAPGGLIVFQLPSGLSAHGDSETLQIPSRHQRIIEPLPLKAFKAQTSTETSILNVEAASRHNIRVTVTNVSDTIWPSLGNPDGTNQIRLGARWYNANRTKLVSDDGRANLPHDLRPGDRLDLQLTIKAPSTPGNYILELDMVQEMIAWFSQHGSQTCQVKVAVFSPRHKPGVSQDDVDLESLIDMHIVPQETVRRWILLNRGKLIATKPARDAPGYISYRYFVTK